MSTIEQAIKEVNIAAESKQMKVVQPKWLWYAVMKKLSETDEQGQRLASLIYLDIKNQE